MNKYLFKEYNKNYPKLFLKEKKKLKKYLPKEIIIEHMGSTAVKGLGGKGFIDLMLGFKNKNQIKKFSKIIEKKGYKIIEGFKRFNRISFKKEYGLLFWKRRVHIHLLLLNERLWKRNIIFRDNLRKNKEIMKEYIKIKKEAVKIAKGDGQKYRDYKDKFIKKYSKQNAKYY